MKRRFIRYALTAALLGAATGAQAQVALECPSAAAGPATPITIYTGADWGMRYGASGTWEPAYTGYRHTNWYPADGDPADGSWLSPGPIDASPLLPTVDPWYYRTPVIEVDARIDLDTIAVEIQHAVDNYYRATGVMNTAQPDGVMVLGNGGHDAHGSLGAGFTPALTGWITGNNRVLIRTENAEDTHGTAPTGLYAILNITARCVAAPNVSIDLSGLPTTGTEGQPYSGSFSCTNSGASTANDAPCTLTGLPSGVTVGACTISPNDDPWTSPSTIPAGETVTCPVSGTPDSGSNGTYPLTGTGGSATATATLVIAGAPDVMVNLGGLPDTGTINQPYSGSFTCTNNGSAAANDAPCTLTGLPSGVTVGACTISPNGDPWASPSTIPAGETVTCPVSGTPDSSSIGTHPLTGTGGTHTASATLTIAGMSNVVIDLDGLPNTGTINQPYSGSFTCTNTGTASAASAACEVTNLPPGITLQGCTISPNGDPWTSPAEIPPGEVVTCTVSGTPTQAGSSTATGTGGSNTATRNITIRQRADAVLVPTLTPLGLMLTAVLLAGLAGLTSLRRRA